MAILQLEDSSVYTHLSDITRKLAALNIQVKRLPLGSNSYIGELLAQDILSLAEKEEILAGFDRYFVQFQRRFGYKWRELTVLHPGSPYLWALITQFDRCHTHADEEALYILSGECVFGFVLPDGRQAELIVEAEEFINVPSGTEHWFRPTGLLHFKAVRYFTSVGGWTPQYTDTKIHFHKPVARRYPGDCP
ncbi:cupin domain-containing protein [Planktothrix sp. FACHB-1355]|uniref:acireductone dioxygenase (Fe(2+)-requiring) n=1 Tax=Aerosakkonema funiforme FACHB-1375 TaxID=2949571 RepID=A0A926VJB6_9CYAN|nr:MULTISPECIES: cupin domain-containing protein [Oscillatoriales]MBD2183762.1 cupin domain-containing protein [Aerosakkonema funiforme FACHB-1375]MBD3561221.1 cupin domain-containing protein [Planktothrix sp. FACHB-1355]